MKKKIIIDQDGKIRFDGVDYAKKDIDSKLLDTIFQSSLKGEIEFEINDSDSIALLFKRIMEETDPRSKFANQIQGLRELYKDAQEEKDIIEKAEKEEELPF